ncbi:MAG: helix-turn-helix domain-containing protein, partial [Nakamurella sp.]
QSQFSASLKALPPRTPLVREVFEYINADPTRPATLSRLSAHVHVSPRHLTRLVKDELGVTPLEYIASVRVDLATGYLESGATVAHASHRAGFTSPAAFRRAFQSRRGVMPSVYQHHFRTTNRSLTS